MGNRLEERETRGDSGVTLFVCLFVCSLIAGLGVARGVAEGEVVNQADGLALPATITLRKNLGKLSSGSLSRKPLPLFGKKRRRGQRTSGEKVRWICQKVFPSNS